MTPNPDLYEQARTEARRLRRDAIDDFWRGANAALERAWLGPRAFAERSAQRLQAQLARRTRRMAT